MRKHGFYWFHCIKKLIKSILFFIFLTVKSMWITVFFLFYSTIITLHNLCVWNIFSFPFFFFLRLHLLHNMLDCPMLVHWPRNESSSINRHPALQELQFLRQPMRKRHRCIDWMMHLYDKKLSESCSNYEVSNSRLPIHVVIIFMMLV